MTDTNLTNIADFVNADGTTVADIISGAMGGRVLRASDDAATIGVIDPCYRCGGSGVFGNYGVCFKCNGGRTQPNLRKVRVYRAGSEAQARRLNAIERAANKRVAAAEARENARAATANDWREANAELAGMLAELVAADDDFGISLNGAVDKWGALTERQAAAVPGAHARLVARRAEAETAAPVVEGRIVIEGELITIKEKATQYGIVDKALVRDARGFKVWGTLPRAIADAQRGDTVRFTATVEASSDDATFGFYKRPTGATIITEAA